MAMSAENIKTMIAHSIEDADVVIEDLRGDGEHYAAVITAKAFEGKTRIEQHRMVQAALNGKLGTDLHALQIHTRIPKNKED